MDIKLVFKMLSAFIVSIFTSTRGLFMPIKAKEICMIAHRGYSGKYLQNTELAFVQAARHGSGGAETDIRITSDGVYVTSHNPEAVSRQRA